MKRKSKQILQLSLLLLQPVATLAATPPYWPYPPSPYYYPPPAAIQPLEERKSNTPPPVTTEEDGSTPKSADDTKAAFDVDSQRKSSSDLTTEAKPPLADTRGEIAGSTRKHETDSKNEVEPAIILPAEAEQSLKEALSREIARDIQQGNFAEAYYLWRPRAEAGDAEAQYGIGWMYHNGYGLAINDQEAITWWEMASRQGHIDATFALGMLYGLGEGDVRRDTERAIHYYHLAAAKGHEDAKLLLLSLIQQNNRDAHQLMLSLLEKGRLEEISDTPAAAVISDKANVRKGSGTQHKILTTLNKGHALFPIKRQGHWLLVGIADKSFIGWIHDSLVGKDILTSD